MLKSFDTTGTFQNTLRPSNGKASILLSTKMIKLSIPELGKGKLLSYEANSPPLAAPPLAGGGALAGGAFFSSFLGGAPFPAAAPVGGGTASSGSGSFGSGLISS